MRDASIKRKEKMAQRGACFRHRVENHEMPHTWVTVDRPAGGEHPFFFFFSPSPAELEYDQHELRMMMMWMWVLVS